MPMKTTLLIAVLTLGLLPGISKQADARPSHSSLVFISGHQRCGTPIYSVRYISGYTSCGRAIWRVRPLTWGELRRYQQASHRSWHHRPDSGRHAYSYQRRCRSW